MLKRFVLYLTLVEEIWKSFDNDFIINPDFLQETCCTVNV